VIIEGQAYLFPPEKVSTCRKATYFQLSEFLQQSYGDAKKECEKQGMLLGSMDGKKEKKDVSDYLKYIGLESEAVFSALGALASPGSNFDGWGKEPLPPGDCTATLGGAFYNTSCDKKSNFICEETPYTGPPTPAP